MLDEEKTNKLDPKASTTKYHQKRYNNLGMQFFTFCKIKSQNANKYRSFFYLCELKNNLAYLISISFYNITTTYFAISIIDLIA